VDEFEPNTRRVVVTSRGVRPTLLHPNRWIVAPGANPFLFARNANIGILSAGEDDVVLMNDDVRLITKHSLRELERVAYLRSSIGIVSPQVVGVVGNPLQDARSYCEDASISEERLCFVCVYIKREVIRKVGSLDERFNGYGGDDDDYSLRTQLLGYDLVVTKSCMVCHGFGSERSSSSFARTLGTTKESMTEMNAALDAKWHDGVSPMRYAKTLAYRTRV